jgi:hypothetical protein
VTVQIDAGVCALWPKYAGAIRPPDWRWQRASWLYERRRRPGRHDDGALRACHAFLGQTQRGKARSAAARQVGQVIAQIRDGDARRRWLLEAWLLAGVGVEEAARRMCVSPVLAQWYHDLFFDVVERLFASDWVMKVILDGRERHAVRADDEEYMAKHYAYHGGPVMLEGVLAYFRIAEAAPGGPSPQCLPERLTWLRVRAALLARTLPADPGSVNQLFELRVLAEQGVDERKEALVLGSPIRPGVAVDDLVARCRLGARHVGAAAG